MSESLTCRLSFTIPKVKDQQNEDCYQTSPRKGVYAISDGASISFDSASWARILARNFAKQPSLSLDWVATAIAEFAKKYDREKLPWMQQAAFDKGSFASLLGIKVNEDMQSVDVVAIGDSLAVLCEGQTIRETFPYSTAAQFDQSPQLLSTNPAENSFLNHPDRFSALTTTWNIKGLYEPSLLCMTDALGQWLLNSREKTPAPVTVLRSLRDPKAFSRFVVEERESGRIRRDDTTFLALW